MSIVSLPSISPKPEPLLDVSLSSVITSSKLNTDFLAESAASSIFSAESVKLLAIPLMPSGALYPILNNVINLDKIEFKP